MSIPTGSFVWYEIYTTDLDRSRRFFSELFNWNIHETDVGGPTAYHMIRSGDQDIGGMEPIDKKSGGRSHWLGYATVPDVDRAATETARAGGKVIKPGTDVPGVGRYAILQDPTGAVLAAFRGSGEPPSTSDPEACEAIICWRECMTTDPASAVSFYTRIFGWGHGEMPMGEAGTYHLLKCGDRDEAGLMKTPPDVPSSSWMYYVHVSDVDASASRIKQLGGQIFVAPRDIPEVGRFAVGADPTGCVFAVFKGLPR